MDCRGVGGAWWTRHVLCVVYCSVLDCSPYLLGRVSVSSWHNFCEQLGKRASVVYFDDMCDRLAMECNIAVCFKGQP